jgi:hypothetical protein
MKKDVATTNRLSAKMVPQVPAAGPILHFRNYNTQEHEVLPVEFLGETAT